MTGRVRIVCRPALASGWAPVGVPCREAADGPEAEARLAEFRADPATAVVLVEEELFDALSEETRRAISASPLPMVVPFPGPTWVSRPPAEEYIVELLRQAIGYRVRIG